jgi:muconolactone D-isomerase
MEFLVEIQVNLPADMDPARRLELTDQERRRGAELQAAGVIRRIWRIPGRIANVAIWEAPDATALHAAITSLPLFPWIDATVTALATHPLEATEPAADRPSKLSEARSHA